jgi:hypothetical protein
VGGRARLVGEEHGFAGGVAGAPHVPAGDGAPGAPLFRAALDLVDGGEHRRVEGFRFWEAEEGEGESFAHAVVGDGENVGAAEAEDEEHLHGPRADAADLGQPLDDFLIGHAADGGEGGNGSVEGLRREIAQGFGLASGEAAGAEHVVGGLQQEFGRGVEFAECGEQALEDGGGGFTVKLLINDGLEQCFKGGVLAFEFQREGADAPDERAEFGIGGGESTEGQSGIVANGAASIDHEKQGTDSQGAAYSVQTKLVEAEPLGRSKFPGNPREPIRSPARLQIGERAAG